MSNSENFPEGELDAPFDKAAFLREMKEIEWYRQLKDAASSTQDYAETFDDNDTESAAINPKIDYLYERGDLASRMIALEHIVADIENMFNYAEPDTRMKIRFTTREICIPQSKKIIQNTPVYKAYNKRNLASLGIKELMRKTTKARMQLEIEYTIRNKPLESTVANLPPDERLPIVNISDHLENSTKRPFIRQIKMVRPNIIIPFPNINDMTPDTTSPIAEVKAIKGAVKQLLNALNTPTINGKLYINNGMNIDEDKAIHLKTHSDIDKHLLTSLVVKGKDGSSGTRSDLLNPEAASDNLWASEFTELITAARVKNQLREEFEVEMATFQTIFVVFEADKSLEQ